jgi:hypothetical protein
MLDERLRELLSQITTGGHYVRLNRQAQQLVDSQSAQIKQAFADEGYVHVPQVEVVTRYEAGKKPEVFMVNGKEVMTGQEWYSRFEPLLEDIDLNSPTRYQQIKTAAKKASRLE